MDSNKPEEVVNTKLTNKENLDEEALKEERKKSKLDKKQKKLDAKDKKEKKQTEEKDTKKPEKPKVEIESSKPKVYYESSAKLIRPNLNEPIFVKEGEKNILITSALPYVNNVPHLGNLIGCVLSADVYARFCRLMGYNTLYICGTDEYGTATETKAIEEKCTPKELCDKFHFIHKGIYEWFDIDFDYFGRTSTPVHTEITQEIFNDLSKNGFIKKNKVEQYKCTTCNIFLADRYIIGKCYQKPCTYEEARGDQCDGCGKLCNALELIDPKCKQCKSSPIIASSMHYYLELPDVEKRLKEWVTTTSNEGKWSNNSKTITNSFLSDGLKPRCITRDLKWGVEVPTDEEDMKNKVFYVWFDAPIGYLSITANFIKDGWERWWKNPENVKLYQFMGKDNVTFHTVIFPSTLLGTEKKFTLVHHLSTTEYLNYENKKFSKTHSTGVFGDSAKSSGIPSEIWRYYLLANRPEQSDTDFKWDDFMAKNNNELLNNLGNFVNRVLKFTSKNYKLKVPKFKKDENIYVEKDKELLFATRKLVLEYITALENVKIKDGLRIFMEVSSLGNTYLQETEPWAIIKTNPERSSNILFIMMNFVRLIGCLAEPYMPSFSAKLYELINLKYNEEASCLLNSIHDCCENQERFDELFLSLVKEEQDILDPLPLFKESKK